MTFIHLRGGWRGHAIDWSTDDPVNPGLNGFDGDLRRKKEQEMQETIDRLRALITNRHEDSLNDTNFYDDSDSDFDDLDDAPVVLRDAE